MASFASAVKPTPPVITTAGALYIQESGISTFKYNYDHDFEFHVFNSTAGKVTNLTATCDFHIYNRSGAHIVDEHKIGMDTNLEDFEYEYNASTHLISAPGTYSYIIWCTNNGTGVTKESGYSQAQFYVTYSGEQAPDDLTPLGIMFLIPLFLAFLCMVSISVLGEGHAAFKMFMFLASFLCVFVSYNYAVEVIGTYYDSLTLQNFVASDYVWLGYVFYIIIIYFILYWIIQIFEYMSGKKNAQLNFEEHGKK